MADKKLLVLAISVMFSLSVVALAYAEDAAPPATTDAGDTGGGSTDTSTSSGSEGGTTTDTDATGTEGGETTTTPTPEPTPTPETGEGEGEVITPLTGEGDGGEGDTTTPPSTGEGETTQPETGGETEAPCPAPPPPIDCGTNARVVDDFDSRGCMTGHHCETTIGGGGEGGGAGPTTPSGGGGCPPVPPGIQCQYGVIDDFDSNGCLVGRHCRTESEVGGTAQPSMVRECPVDSTCPDGSRPCQLVDNRCECKPCPPPQGCREEKDATTGFVRVICEAKIDEMKCPDTPYGADKPCRDKGGNPVWKTDSRGCNFIDCVLNDVSSNPFSANRVCPTEEEIQRVKSKCLNFVMIDDMGCKVAVCRDAVQQQVRQECGLVPGPERERIEAECKAKGLGTVSSFDENGCQTITCGNPNECRTSIPEGAYEKCRERGGEMVVKNDNMGCITFQQCVMKGDESQIYYEDVTEMPEMTDMLSMAFKLEELKMQFDKLRAKTEDVARYYESVGSGEAERFKRVAGMFNSIKDKIDEIKTKFRDRLETITRDDISEIKYDIKYIKDKMLKDVLYLMLSSSDEVKSITSKSESDCGNDGRCFDEALRVCKQMVFHPDDAEGNAEVKISGMDGTNCLITVTAQAGTMGTQSMTCKYPNYAMGMRGPEDILPYCTGALAELMKTYGTKPPEVGPTQQPETRPAESCPQQPAPITCGTNERVVDEFDSNGCITARHCEAVSSSGGDGGVAPCSGCLNNGVCDPGECKDCADCMGGGT